MSEPADSLTPDAPVARWIANRHEAAAVLGVSTGQVTALAEEGMDGVERDGRQGAQMAIDLTKAVPWYVRRQVERAEDRNSPSDQLRREQARKAARENAEAEKELIPVDAVGAALMRLATVMGAQLFGIPGRCASDLAGIKDPALVRDRLMDEFREVRVEFSKAIATLPELPAVVQALDDHFSRDRQSAGEDEPGPVGGSEPHAAAG